jgi:hypothetical protein
VEPEEKVVVGKAKVEEGGNLYYMLTTRYSLPLKCVCFKFYGVNGAAC